MAKKVKQQREELPAKVGVVNESVSACHIEEEDSQFDQREVSHTSSSLSLGNGGYRTLPSFTD